MENKTTAKKPKRNLLNNNFVRLLLALFILACCAGLGIGIAVLEDKSDPTAYVAQYFGKFLVQDYKGMYEYIDKDNAYLPLQSFTNFMAELRANNNIGDYEFEEIEKTDGRYLITVSYKDIDTDEDKTFDIYLEKFGGTLQQPIASWKISIDDYLVNSFTISVPRDMSLSIDGVEVDQSFLSGNTDVIKISENETMVVTKPDVSSDENIRYYRIENMLAGKHQLKAFNKYTEITKEIELTSGGQTEELPESSIVINADYTKRIEEITAAFIKEFYEVVRNRKKSSKTLLAYLDDNQKTTDRLKKLAGKSQDIIYPPDTRNIDDYNLLEYNFSELNDAIDYVGDDTFKVTSTYSYDYLSSTDTELYSSYVFQIEGKCTSTLDLTYKVTGDDIKIVDIAMKNKDKKSEE